MVMEMFPDTQPADLHSLRESKNLEQDLDDIFQMRMTVAEKAKELHNLRAAAQRVHPALPSSAPAPFTKPVTIPPDFFARLSSTTTTPAGPTTMSSSPTRPSASTLPFSPPALFPVSSGFPMAALYVPPTPTSATRAVPAVPAASPAAAAAAFPSPAPTQSDVGALQRIFGPLYSAEQLRGCIARNRGNLIAAVRELLPPDVPAVPPPEPMAGTGAPIRSLSSDDTVSDPAILAAMLLSTPTGQRFDADRLVDLAAALVPCSLTSALDLLGGVPLGQEQRFIDDYAMGRMQEDPAGPESLFECVICLEKRPVDQMAFLSCDHAFCFDCLRQHVETAVEGNLLPACPSCPDRRRLTQEDTLMPFADQPTTPFRPRIEKLYLQASLAEGGAIPCPRPGCQNAVMPSMAGRKEHCVCECGFEFCSLCQEVFHYETSCAEARAAAGRWDAWVQIGREEHLRVKAREDATWRTRLEEYEKKKDKYSRENQEAMRRRTELGRDEEWKVANCRLCPNCNRCIERMSGCDSMICGTDAHGGNAQNGCGRAFNWTTAAHYVKIATGGPKVPDFTEVEPARANDDITITEGVPLMCDLCHSSISGLGFRCVNCPGLFSVCLSCEAGVTSGRHNGHHVFRAIRHATDGGGAAAAAAAADDDDDAAFIVL